MEIASRRLAVKILALGLSSALVLVSPGLGCYGALAAGFEAPEAGAEAPANFSLAPLSTLNNAVLPGGAPLGSIGGVNIPELLSGLERAPSLTPEEADVLRGVEAAGTSQERATVAVARLAELAARVRAQANALPELALGAKKSGDALGFERAVTQVSAYRNFLNVPNLEKLNAAQKSLAGMKTAQAQGLVAQARRLWGKPAPAIVKAGADVDAARGLPSGLLEPSGASGVQRGTEIPAPRHASAVVSLARKISSVGPGRWRRLLSAAAVIGGAAALILTHGAALSVNSVLYGAALMSGILLHETGHLYLARRLGDDTARRFSQGSLNPFKHVDPWGTVVLPFLSLVASSTFLHVPLLLGWAKPIPVDYNKLADPKRDAAKVAFAGPAANAAAAALAWGARLALVSTGVIVAGGLAASALQAAAVVNLALAAFNLLAPLPHADGFKIGIRWWPTRVYRSAWARNPELPNGAYQGIFRRLYEGPANPLAWLSRHGFSPRRVQRLTWGLGLAAFSAASLAGYFWLGLPVVGIALACSQAYYCIYEKVQNEEAVKSLRGILGGWARWAADLAEKGELRSEVDSERFENIMAEVLDGDLMDEVIGSEGFDSLSNDEKWSRFQDAFIGRAAEALHADPRGLPDDDVQSIRQKLFESQDGQARLAELRRWMEQRWDGRDIWSRWRTEKRKGQDGRAGGSQGEQAVKKAGTMLGLIAVAALGGLALPHILGAHVALSAMGPLGLLLGSIEDSSTPPAAAARLPQKPFLEAAEDPAVDLSREDKKFLTAMFGRRAIEEIVPDETPVIGRLEEMNKMVPVIAAPSGDANGVVLVGKAGVGKTAVLRKVIQAVGISRGQEGEGSTFRLSTLDERYYLSLDPTQILDQMAQDNSTAVLSSLLRILAKFNVLQRGRGAKVVLVVDEVHTLFQDAQYGPRIKNLIKKPLERGDVAIVGGTTKGEYDKYIRPDEAIKRRLKPVEVPEYDEAQSLRALQESRSYYERRYGVKIEPSALKAAAENSKVDQEIFLPGRAFHYLIEALRVADFQSRRDRLSLAIQDKMSELEYAFKRLEEEKAKLFQAEPGAVAEEEASQAPSVIDLENAAARLVEDLVALYRQRQAIPSGGVPTVDEHLVNDKIVEETGVATNQLTLGREDMHKYVEMEQSLNKIVVGQEEAVHVISDAVRRSKSGMHDSEDEPIGVFLLTGPTGTGKTYFAKKLADFLFGSENAMIRLDMSEYMQPHEVAKMTGAPPGYVGFEQGGTLTEAVRKHPYSVVLFDEIEKANPAAWLILLQVLADGRLTDGHGRTVSFKNTIVLMSSNVGMMSLDLGPYEKAYAVLKAQWDASEGDEARRAEVEAQLSEFGVRMAREIREKAVAATNEAMTGMFPPEFRGRLQYDPIVFNPMTMAMMEKIAPLELEKVRRKVGQRGNELEWTPEVVKLLVHEGYSVDKGARPLRNAIKNLVESPISREILESAAKGGAQPGPKRIRLSVQKGKINVAVEPLPVKPALKAPPAEAMSREIFDRLVTLVEQAVEENAEMGLTREILDRWILDEIKSHPAEEDAKPAAPATVAEGAAEKTQGTAIAAPAAPAPSQEASLLAQNEAPGLGAQDPIITQGDQETAKEFRTGVARQIKEALEREHYPESVQEALLRSVPSEAEPYEGWLKVFLRQAGVGREGGLQVRYRINPQSAVVSIHASGPLSESEAAFLRAHFTGRVPASAQESLDRAEGGNILKQDSSSRLCFELYRILSAIPGARLGYSTGASGTDYWLELPNPAAHESR
ncbi:MAG TPA: AAA family ATPase [Elusimicrobiota bacterium]|nr:AAA family ATPase [Elusimicrobiota bacterium]